MLLDGGNRITIPQGNFKVYTIYGLSVFKGIIEAHSILDVPLVITPQGLEELEILAQLSIFGSPDPPLVSHNKNVIVTTLGRKNFPSLSLTV